MNLIKSLSRKYYLGFNIPLHILFLICLWFYNINFIYFCFFYILVYWIGIQAGSHKLFSHRSWESRNEFIKYFLAIISCFGLMGGPISWARMHRWHHANSDTNKDPHSPLKGFYFSYFGWLLDPPNVPVFTIRDHLKDKILIKIEERCREFVILGLVITFIISNELGTSLLAAMICTFHSEMLVNAFLHKKIHDKYHPVNNLFFMIISGGSSLHQNHHKFASSPNFRLKRYEIDMSFQFIKMLRK